MVEFLSDREDFHGLLKMAGMRKYQLARRLGICDSTISKWGNNPPDYAIAYLRLYCRVKEGLGMMLDEV